MGAGLSGSRGGKPDLGGRYGKGPWSRLQAQLDVVPAMSGWGHSIPLSRCPTHLLGLPRISPGKALSSSRF